MTELDCLFISSAAAVIAFVAGWLNGQRAEAQRSSRERQRAARVALALTREKRA